MEEKAEEKVEEKQEGKEVDIKEEDEDMKKDE